MSHPEQQKFVAAIRSAFPSLFRGGRVLEVGSLDINGSVRAFFDAGEYIGLDVGEGPGVDVVCEGQKYDALDGSFDVVISAECMEHNPYWRETMLNMFRLCRPGGLVLMTCATSGRKEHGTSRTRPQDAPLIQWDYYKNLTAGDIKTAVLPQGASTAWMICSNYVSRDLYFAAFKDGAPPPPNAYTALRRIARAHRWRNLRNWRGMKEQALIALVGEERYVAGSLLPWKRSMS